MVADRRWTSCLPTPMPSPAAAGPPSCPGPTGFGAAGGPPFADALLESNFTADWDGRASTTLTEYTEEGERGIDLPSIDLYTAVIDHVIACLQGRASLRDALPARR